jgi:predicted lipid-binding transport protein (Tim44 family)
MSGQQPAQPSPFGGFGRALAGGLLGGFLGSLLFRGMGAEGWGAGGGIGLLEIMLLAGLAYLVVAMVRRNRSQEAPVTGYYDRSTAERYVGGGSSATMGEEAPQGDLDRGLRHIQQMDPGFDPGAFTEWAADAFFQVQAGWMHRDPERIRPLLTDEMVREFTTMMEESRAAGRVNKLENITVRSVQPAAAWQEGGQDFLAVRYLANLLDYTVDERTGRVVQGDDRTPVKFEEYWTWVRPVGPNPWKLSAIQQAR